MTAVIAAEGSTLDRVLDARRWMSHNGLSRDAYRTFYEAQTKTAFGRRCQGSYALTEGHDILASAERYDLSGILDGRAVRVCGIGAVCAEPSPSSRDHALVLVEALVDDAARRGAEMALLFPQPGGAHDERDGFHAIPSADLTLVVTESRRHGAPMTMVRAGEPRDFAAIVAMGRMRAEPFRFHLDRDVDFLAYVITTQRLLAGLGAAGARQLHFFIAEEGITAAAYVIVSVAGDVWTLEECGDRDPTGARVGALLQALIARDPPERRPTIRAWFPPRFLPPQVTITSAVPSREIIRVRMLGVTAIEPPLANDDVLFWLNDIL
jgi:hypothetical protein